MGAARPAAAARSMSLALSGLQGLHVGAQQRGQRAQGLALLGRRGRRHARGGFPGLQAQGVHDFGDVQGVHAP